MAANTKIEWATHTLNPWRGCTKISAGCQFCYADQLSKRNPSTLGIWGPNGTRVVASEAMWKQPVKWNRLAACCCRKEPADHEHESGCPQRNRPRVFCASLADIFEQWDGPVLTSNGDNWRDLSKGGWGTLDDVRRRLFALIDATPNLDWLLLTKRPENIRRMLPAYFPGGYIAEAGSMNREGARGNLWLGTSFSTQADADKNIPELLKCRNLAPVLFVSAEPLLGPVDLSAIPAGIDGKINWVITGGESGHHARPMHPDWARGLRDQCQAAGVPFFFKQWGEYLPIGQQPEPFVRVGKKLAGRLLDGVEWNEFPRVRTRLPERHGHLCRVLARGRMNSCLIEFGDGWQLVTSRWYARRVK